MKSLSPLARDANEFKNPYKNKRVKNDSRLRTFLSFFLLACVLGMAVRLFFAPERLTPWLREQIAKSLPHGGVQFKSAELQLSNGVLPMLAVEIRDIEIQAKNACAENIPPIRIQNATLPIDIFRLVKGELALSEISVHKIEVDIEDFQQTCAKPSHAEAYQDVGGQNHAPVAGPVSSPHLVPSSSPEPAANELSFWDEKKLLQIGAQVAGIEFDEVKFYFDHHQKYFILKDFNLRQMGPGDYNLKSEFIWPQEHAKGEILPTAFVNAYLNAKKITVEISSQVSEGRLQLRSVILPAAHSPQIETKIQVHQLPVSSFANYLIKMNLLPPQMQPKFVWLNFTALLKGRLDELKHLPIEFNDILLDGEFGQAKVAHMVRNADSSLSEFKIDLTQINVQKSLELFSVKGPDGVFSHFGNFSGQVDFKSPKSFSLSGDLED